MRADGGPTISCKSTSACECCRQARTLRYVPLKGVDPNLHDSDHPSTFPLPVGGGTEDGEGYQCNTGQADCHLLVADRGHDKLYEAYQATYADDALHAGFVSVWDLNRVYPPSGRGDQCSSSDAAGFPIAPLLFNADEIATGSINHAIRFILPPRANTRSLLCASGHAHWRSYRAVSRSSLWRPPSPEGFL